MNATLSPSPRLRRWGARVALGATLFASLAGAYAFRTLFARPGEAALRLVPADAMMVATLDLSPSASQALAFKRIDDALERNGLNGFMESSLIDLFEPNAKGREALRPLVLRHGAMAMLPGKDGKLDGAQPLALLAVTSGMDAQQALQREGEPRYFKGLKYFKLRHGNQIYMVVDDLLVVAGDPTALYAVKQTRDGAAPGITSVHNFTAARANVADDANLMLFLSPKMLADAPKGTDALMADWMTIGMAIRDGGVGISFGGATDPAKAPALAALGQIAPIRNDLFRVLPSGMYGAMVYSQPSKALEAIEKGVLSDDEDMKKGIKEMETNMRKEVGIDLRKDLLPAFYGTTVLAAYPSAKPAAGVDGLLLVDDLHGADPANAADRFVHWVEEQMEKEGNTQEMFTRREADGVTYFRLAEEPEKEMREGMSEGMSGVKADTLMGNKTIAWAVVGKGVIVSTSQELLERAVASYRANADPLAGDAKFTPAQSDLIDGSQQVAMFSLSRIAEGVKNTVDETDMDKESAKTFHSILAAFETLDEPFTTKMRLQTNGRFAGGTFIPLNYDKLLDLAGDAKKKMDKPHATKAPAPPRRVKG